MNPYLVAAIVGALATVAVPVVARFTARQSANTLIAARDAALNARTDGLFEKTAEMRDYFERKFNECEQSSVDLRAELGSIQRTVTLWEAGRLVPAGYRLVPAEPKEA